MIINGDSAEVLKGFEDNSVHAVITDPPHGLGGEHLECELSEDDLGRPQVTVTFTDEANGFMGADWDKGIGAFEVWRQVYRVLKPGGHVFVMSSERTGAVAGFYMLLKAAGFAIDETQLMGWVALTGMPKSTDVSKTEDKRAFTSWLRHTGRDIVPCEEHGTTSERCKTCEHILESGNLSVQDMRKATSVAVNGGCPPHLLPGGRALNSDTVALDGGRSDSKLGMFAPEASARRFREGEHVVEHLLATEWPDSEEERRSVWDALIDDVPPDWDCSLPPGMRRHVGTYQPPGLAKEWNLAQSKGESDDHVGGTFTASGDRTLSITAPSTPVAARWGGWRGGVAPLKPFMYPIIHAYKPFSGSYLEGAEANDVGPLHIDLCRIPFAGDSDVYDINVLEEWSGLGQLKRPDYVPVKKSGGREPANILSYADLLGDLQRFASLDAWCEAVGLKTASKELLDAGLVYAQKPNKSEKSGFLPEDYDAERNPCAKPVALCAYLMALCTRQGHTVLDPFCGEAPVGVAAVLLNREFIGIELEEDFCNTAKIRIDAACLERDPHTDMQQLEF
jgi:DNA modification methylase